MRLGYLGRLGEMSVNGHMGPFPDVMGHRVTGGQHPSMTPGGGPSVPNSQAGTYSFLAALLPPIPNDLIRTQFLYDHF